MLLWQGSRFNAAVEAGMREQMGRAKRSCRMRKVGCNSSPSYQASGQTVRTVRRSCPLRNPQRRQGEGCTGGHLHAGRGLNDLADWIPEFWWTTAHLALQHSKITRNESYGGVTRKAEAKRLPCSSFYPRYNVQFLECSVLALQLLRHHANTSRGCPRLALHEWVRMTIYSSKG
eukprot:1153644-Pelagomonas_calceolata.AAC.7